MVSGAAQALKKASRAPLLRSTTVLHVRRDGKVCMGSDGQVTLGDAIVKQTAAKVKRTARGKVLVGFAGGGADALALFTRFEAKLEEHHGNLERAVVELAKDWRTDRMLRQLEAMMIVADRDQSLPGLGQRRPHPARRDGSARRRLGRQLRARRRARAAAQHHAVRRRDRPRGAAHRRRDLHLHQRPHHPRGAGVTTAAPPGVPALPPAASLRWLEELTPRQIVAELDRYIVGQKAAKNAVAIALRNRWRRQRLTPAMADEIYPKNILMIGPTGVGKTEIARRLAKLAHAPSSRWRPASSPRWATSAATSSRWCATSSRWRWRWCAQEKRESVRVRAAERAEERLLQLLLPHRAPGISGPGFGLGGYGAAGSRARRGPHRRRAGRRDAREAARAAARRPPRRAPGGGRGRGAVAARASRCSRRRASRRSASTSRTCCRDCSAARAASGA